jgi:hypothetical protein
MKHTQLVRILGVGAAGALALAFFGCDSGAGGNGGSSTGGGTSSGNTSSSGNSSSGNSSSGNSSSGNSSSGNSSSGSTAGAVMCTNGYCSQFGEGGYAFADSDSQNMSPMTPGTSTATLAADGSLCISGNVMKLPANPTQADYSNDWGAGIGINLNQAADAGPTVMGTYTLTGTGVTVGVNGIPSCTTARVIVNQGGMDYCAPLTGNSTTVPWSMFNTACWMPSTGTALSGPPTSTQLKVQFVTSKTAACPFTSFCITNLSL